MSAARISCAVPYCGRTTAAGRFVEWICGQHWRAVPKPYRRAYARVRRRIRRDPKNPLLRKCAGTLWSCCKRRAIEAAVGL